MDCLRFREDMLDVLYGEASVDVAERFEAHRSACTDCDDEISGLRGVRRDLQSWRYEAPGARRRILPFLPGMRGLAAAASIALAFGGGMALARTEITYRDGELRVMFGPRGATPVAKAAATTANTEIAQILARHDAEHRAAIQAEMQQVRASLTQQQPVSSANPQMLLEQVQQMIRASEARQAMMIRSGLSEVAQRADAQHDEAVKNIRYLSTGLDQLRESAGLQSNQR